MSEGGFSGEKASSAECVVVLCVDLSPDKTYSTTSDRFYARRPASFCFFFFFSFLFSEKKFLCNFGEQQRLFVLSLATE